MANNKPFISSLNIWWPILWNVWLLLKKTELKSHFVCRCCSSFLLPPLISIYSHQFDVSRSQSPPPRKQKKWKMTSNQLAVNVNNCIHRIQSSRRQSHIPPYCKLFFPCLLCFTGFWFIKLLVPPPPPPHHICSSFLCCLIITKFETIFSLID